MRTPTRIPARPPNPYDELASLADPEETLEAIPVPVGVPHDPAAEADDDTHASPGPVEDDPLGLGLTYDSPDDRLGEESAEEEAWSPPDHRRARRPRSRRRRRRFSAVPRTAKLLFGVVACAAFLALADRCAVMYAEKKAQQTLQRQLHLEAAPQVDIHGFPFLTQVFTKRLSRVDVTVPDVAADRVSLAKVKASAHDVRLTGNLPADVRGAVIGNLDGEVLLAFDDLNRELGASQVRFSDHGDNSIRAVGKLSVAGEELRVRAQARLRQDGDRGISTDIDGMSVDIPRVATYRPGRDKGLVLHRETADRVSRDAARAKALLSVPAVAERLGVPKEAAALALRDEDRLREITGAPRFVERLMRVNLVDVVVDHPWLLKRIGIDPKLVTALMGLRPPELSDRLSLSFQLPKQARDLHLRHVTVERDGIRADLTGVELPIGKGR
ncbi:LmeA family phospholipid-binding protein [Streptomyces syringium]|uniref:LmeA family phospholipid-binding protein n=1 Tax=Streptomyces syringium TaxID=76729 RepID=UPI003428787A